MVNSKFTFQTITPNRKLPFRLLIHNTGAEHIVPRHWHTSFEISYVITGENENFYLDGQLFDQAVGEVIVVNPYQVHGLNLPQDIQRVAMTIMLPKEFLQSVGLDYRSIRLKSHILADAVTLKLLHDLYQVTLSDNTDKTIRQIGLTCLIFSQLIDDWSEHVNQDETLEISKGLGYLDPVLIWLEENYMSQINIIDMARVANLSESYFAHLFKKYIQQSPMEYLNLLRLHHAQQLLRNTSLSIVTVAEKTGFPNYISFVNAFKRIYQTTPKKYQKLYKSRI